jgi:uncharacterized membrane protein YkvA (DUF1232 family)
MLKLISRLKFILNIPRFIPFLIDFFRSAEVPASRKILSILFIVGYGLFPFDLIPDFFLGLGILDDLAVLGFVLQQLVKLAPESLREKYKLK